MSIGQVGYEAYGETAEWKTYDGRDMPTWETLSESESGQETQRRWEVAAEVILATAPAPETESETPIGWGYVRTEPEIIEVAPKAVPVGVALYNGMTIEEFEGRA